MSEVEVEETETKVSLTPPERAVADKLAYHVELFRNNPESKANWDPRVLVKSSSVIDEAALQRVAEAAADTPGLQTLERVVVLKSHKRTFPYDQLREYDARGARKRVKLTRPLQAFLNVDQHGRVRSLLRNKKKKRKSKKTSDDEEEESPETPELSCDIENCPCVFHQTRAPNPGSQETPLSRK